MTVKVVRNTFQVNVAGDLAHIVGTDNGNLGLPTGSVSPDQVTYNELLHNWVDDRMNTLVNGLASNPITVTGVDSTFVLSDGTPITSAAGVTIVDDPTQVNAAGTGLKANATITIIYDTSGCGGSGYCVYDRGGNSIAMPTEVILFHELAHAFHWASNNFDSANAEPQAENDENQLRDQEGITERDPNSHYGGCNNCGGKGCFIATAAFGSPVALEVEAFRQIRDRVIARSLLGSAFVEHLLAEYYEFSPLVAADMAGDEHTREAVRSFVVRPLLAYLRLVDEFIRSGGVDPRRLRLIADIDLNEFVGVLRDEGIHLDAVEEAKVQWHRLVIGNPPLTPSARWNPAWAAAYLAEKASDGRRRLLFVEWALAEPIGVYWGWIETVMRVGTVGVDLKLEFVLTDWLSRVPMPQLAVDLSPSALTRDLGLASRTVWTSAGVRAAIGRRLLAIRQWEDPEVALRTLSAVGYGETQR